MNTSLKSIAQKCLEAAENNTQTFPEIVGILIDAGFEGYTIDFRRSTASYYLPSGESFDLSLGICPTPIGKKFDTPVIQAAIKEAQSQAKNYTYQGFCALVMHAGCAGYIVSFLGKRVLYFGRTAEIHTELFP